MTPVEMPAMARTTNHTDEPIEALLDAGRWAAAEKRIAVELESDPRNHWLLTQRGVTLYERRKYAEAAEWFSASLRVKPDCPLTLWHVAGLMDTTGDLPQAVLHYCALFNADPGRDECWEGRAWAAALKADCAFRIGDCLESAGADVLAWLWFRTFVDSAGSSTGGLHDAAEGAARLERLTAKGVRPSWTALRIPGADADPDKNGFLVRQTMAFCLAPRTAEPRRPPGTRRSRGAAVPVAAAT